MRNSLFALSLSLLLSSVATAQDATESGAQTGPEQDASAADISTIEEQLSLGEDANAEPEIGQTYISEIIGDWELQCIKTETGDDPCQMYQLLTDEADTPVAEITIFRLPEGGRAVAGAVVIVPLETSLPQQLVVQVDGGKARRYPYAFCNPIGCYARIGLVAEEIASFRAGNEAKVTIVPAAAPDQSVELTMSLTGFTASYEKSSEIRDIGQP